MTKTIKLMVSTATISMTASAVVAAAPISIVSATYGSLPNGRICDATALVASQCTGRAACSVPVGNGMCGDSDFLVVKSAQIKFTCGRTQHELITSEYTTATLACQ